MRILHTVKSYSPLSGGMYEVVRQISEGLVKKGHDVTIASGKRSSEAQENIPGLNIEVFDMSKTTEVERYQDYLLTKRFDIVTNFAAQQPMTDAVFPILSKMTAKKVLVPTGFNALHSRTHRIYFQKMTQWMKEYDLNIFLSNIYQDITFARKGGLPREKILVIPNGASKEEFFNKKTLGVRERLGIDKASQLILHVGSFTGVKGHQEAIEIFSRARIVNAILLFVGNGDTNCAHLVRETSKRLNLSEEFKKTGKRIIVSSLSREETVSVYKESDLFLFPSNTECSPIVLFEAMAAGIPFLASEVGNVKEIIEWSSGGVLLPTRQNALLGRGWMERTKKGLKMFFSKIGFNFWSPDIAYARVKIRDSAKILEMLLNDVERRRSMGYAGRNAWLRDFTWEAITDRYEQAYKRLLSL